MIAGVRKRDWRQGVYSCVADGHEELTRFQLTVTEFVQFSNCVGMESFEIIISGP